MNFKSLIVASAILFAGLASEAMARATMQAKPSIVANFGG